MDKVQLKVGKSVVQRVWNMRVIQQTSVVCWCQAVCQMMDTQG